MGKPHQVFLAIFLFTGLLFVFITPPIEVVDESVHFYRAYQVSQLNFVPDNIGQESGGSIPISLTRFVGDSLLAPNQKYNFMAETSRAAKINLNPQQKQTVQFTNVAIYPPVNYFPQALGIDVGRLFTSKVMVLFYLGRLFNLLFLAICLFLAIRLIPRGKVALMILGLMPMVLYVGASFSADSFVIASVALYIAYLFKLITGKTITTKQWLILAGLAAAVALSKQTYFVLIISALGLAFRKYSGRFKKRELVGMAGVIMISLMFSAAWLLVTRHLNTTPTELQHAVGIYPNSHVQRSFILGHPLSFIKLSILSVFDFHSVSGLLGRFGVYDIVLPVWSMILLVLVIILSFGMPQDYKMGLKGKQTIPFYLAFFINLCIILLGLYLFWASPYASRISELQGRYLIPLIIVLIPVLIGRYRHSVPTKFIITGQAVVLFTSLFVLCSRFYSFL